VSELQSCEWIPDPVAPLHRSVCRHAHSKVGTWEDMGPNRGKLIDEWNGRAGVPLGSYWCASFVAAMWEDGGQGEVPPPLQRSSCDAWLNWAHQTGRYSKTPYYGSAVVYGIPGDASHIGIVVRLNPVICVVEGNTSMNGFSRNGVAVDFKEAALNRVLGYVALLPDGR
jgi:hypothetical protein